MQFSKKPVCQRGLDYAIFIKLSVYHCELTRGTYLKYMYFVFWNGHIKRENVTTVIWCSNFVSIKPVWK